ncbi:unnamed protein product [Lepeophtheirus salmonis]|uniref:(salmon louse) hypothetical protein n=1 Tax=Lepeophtheirus salmonis TaxID=72036 RepID=A0A7R8CRZ3_LEPSM|nr:unnamed protein product [Lepeophtheirus salmonis]CAF2911977.1 unnamed protein product [Lepeophtheirus salmonis]
MSLQKYHIRDLGFLDRDMILKWFRNSGDVGGLEVFINLNLVGRLVHPISTDSGRSTFSPILAKIDNDCSAPVLMVGCSWNYDDQKFEHFFNGIIDEVTIWGQSLKKNSSHDLVPLFYGGYSDSYRNINPKQFKAMLKNIDLENPYDASLAASVLEAMLIPSPTEASLFPTRTTTMPPSTTTTTTTSTMKIPSSNKSQNSSSINAKYSPQLSPLLTKSREELAAAQLSLQDALLSMVKGPSNKLHFELPKNVEIRFSLVAIIFKILSGADEENVAKWKAVFESNPRHEGPPLIFRHLHEYILEYMSVIDTTSYERSTYFDPRTRIFNISTSGQDFVFSAYKLAADKLSSQVRLTYPNYKSYEWETTNYEKFGEPRDEFSVPTGMFNDKKECQNLPISIIMSVHNEYRQITPKRRNPFYIKSKKWFLDSKVFIAKFQINLDPSLPNPALLDKCEISPNYMQWNPLRATFYHKQAIKVFPFWSRKLRRKREINPDDYKYNKNNIFSNFRPTGIERRTCVLWNEDFDENGAWDPRKCEAVTSQSDMTVCECKEWGTMAVIAELTEEIPGSSSCSMSYNIVKYIGLTLSLFSLGVFIAICFVSKYVWDMFHLLRAQTSFAWLLSMICMVLSELPAINESINSNIVIGLLLIYFYTCTLLWLLNESHATFKAITSGIINKRFIIYVPFGYGVSLIPVGLAFVLYNSELGSDPLCFISYNNKTKSWFFYAFYALIGTSIILNIISLLNLNTPQTKSTKVVPQIKAQTFGLSLLSLGFLGLNSIWFLKMVWSRNVSPFGTGFPTVYKWVLGGGREEEEENKWSLGVVKTEYISGWICNVLCS